MLETAFKSSLGTSVWSGSRIDATVCWRRFQLGYERNLELAEDAPRLHAGSVIHTALDAWYDVSNKIVDARHARNGHALACAFSAWAGFSPAPGSDLSYLTWGHIENVLKNYFDYWREKETFTPIDVRLEDSQRVGSETPVTAKFEKTQHSVEDGETYITHTFCPVQFQYGGRLDLPVRDPSGNIYVMDHKSTTGNMGDFYFNQFAVSNKNRGYAALLQKLLGESVAGVIINGIYMGKSPRKPDSAFQRRTFHYSEGHIDEWLDNVEAKIAEVQWHREQDSWAQTDANRICTSCQFRRICEASPRVREAIIKRDYRTREFSSHNGA